MLTLETYAEAQTEALGQRLGAALTNGDFVALRGTLGAGKTALTRGIAKGLGVEDGVCSPTYMLVMEHMGRVPLFHFDVYRLEGEAALEAIGFDDYLERGGVIVMEWPERAMALLPEKRIDIDIGITGENARRFVIHTPREWEARISSAVGA